MRCCSAAELLRLKPHFLEKMAANGVSLPAKFFEAEDDSGLGLRSSFAAGSFGGAHGHDVRPPADRPGGDAVRLARAGDRRSKRRDSERRRRAYPRAQATIVTSKPSKPPPS